MFFPGEACLLGCVPYVWSVMQRPQTEPRIQNSLQYVPTFISDLFLWKVVCAGGEGIKPQVG